MGCLLIGRPGLRAVCCARLLSGHRCWFAALGVVVLGLGLPGAARADEVAEGVLVPDGARVFLQLDAPSDTNVVTLDGVAGEHVRLVLAGVGASSGTIALSQLGTDLATSTFDDGVIDDVTLPATGSYSVTVE